MRAGAMSYEGTLLKADNRKGLIRVAVDEQELTHFLWSERNADGSVKEPAEVDIIVFPGETTFEKASDREKVIW